jgi:transposase
MGRKKLTLTEKTKVMMLWREKNKTRVIVERLGLTMRTVQKIIKRFRDVPEDVELVRKAGSGRPKKTGEQVAKALRRSVTKNPTITAKELKQELPELLSGLSVRTIQRRLLVDLRMPSRKAAKKPLITDKIKKKRLAFAKKYRSWTKEDWGKVMFSDESTFRTLRMVSRTVRRPIGSYRYSSRYTVKTIKHPAGMMAWACFTGDFGRGGLYFLPQKLMMNGDRYLDVLKNHLLPFMVIQKATHFLQDGAPCHKSKKITEFLMENKLQVIDWPGNSPDLNPIENVWAYMKNKLKEKAITSVPTLEQEIKMMWIKDISKDYFKKLTDSMPERIRLVIEHNGEMTKY